MSHDRSRIMSALMGSMYALLASASANPVLINLSHSTIFYAMVMMMIALTPSKEKKTEENSPRK